MDWLKGMNDVLEFIEDNLSQPIQYESLSKIVGCSVYAGGIGRHFQIAASASRTAKKL